VILDEFLKLLCELLDALDVNLDGMLLSFVISVNGSKTLFFIINAFLTFIGFWVIS